MQNFEEFNSELIEEQLAQFSRATGEQPIEARMVQDLAAFYARDASMLEHVWQRLESAQARQTAPKLLSLEERRQKKDTLMDIEKEHESLQKQTMYATKSPKKPIFRVFTTLAAALVGVIIVGSLLFAFGAMKQQHTTKTTGRKPRQNVAVQQVTPLPTPPNVGNAAGLYVDSNGLYRLDPVTGKQLWFYDVHALQGENIKGGPELTAYAFATGDGMVFVGEIDSSTGTYSNVLDGLDATTGKKLWTLPLAAQSLQFANGTLYVDLPGEIEAINPHTGVPIWTNGALGGLCDIAGITDQAVYCIAYAQGGASGKTQIFALRTDNGKLIWTKPIDGLQVEGNGMTYANGALYVAGSSGTGVNLTSAPNYIMAYSAVDGRFLWKSDSLSGFIRAAPTAANGLVYIGTPLNHLYALDANTGHIKWQKQPGGDVSGPAYVAGNTLIVASRTGTGSQIIAYDATSGAFKWSQTAPGLNATYDMGSSVDGNTQLIVSGNTIYYLSDTLHMLDVATGNSLPSANIQFRSGYWPTMMIWSQES